MMKAPVEVEMFDGPCDLFSPISCWSPSLRRNDGIPDKKSVGMELNIRWYQQLFPTRL